MRTTTKKLTVKNQRGVKAGLVTKSSLLIECLSEAIMLNAGTALSMS